MPKIYVHIVTYNSEQFITECIDSLLKQESVLLGDDFEIHVTDNASKDSTLTKLNPLRTKNVITTLRPNEHNLGFAGAHNQGAYSFLKADADYLLILNPDIILPTDCLKLLLYRIEETHKELKSQSIKFGGISPLLFRADDKLNPIEPKIVDTTGIVFTNNYRHFDRFAESGENNPELFKESFIEGISGAFMVLTREFIQDVALTDLVYESDKYRVFPQLQNSEKYRHQLFDEAFFAYREDAELSIRGRRLGWKFKYLPNVVGYHVRRVTPEKRRTLPAEINLHGVRNRFLLQLNTFNFKIDKDKVLKGLVWRNLIVLAGIIILERTSLKAFSQIKLLWRRAKERNEKLYSINSETK